MRKDPLNSALEQRLVEIQKFVQIMPTSMYAKLVVAIISTRSATNRMPNVRAAKRCMEHASAPVRLVYGPDPAQAQRWLCERGYFVDWRMGDTVHAGKLGIWMTYIQVMEEAAAAHKANTSTHTLWIENDVVMTDEICREAVRATNADKQDSSEWYTYEGEYNSLNLINNRHAANFLEWAKEVGIKKPLDIQVWGSKRNSTPRKFKTAKPARREYPSTITTTSQIKIDGLTKARICQY